MEVISNKILNEIINDAKKRAKKKGVEFQDHKVHRTWLTSELKKNDFRCSMTGLPLSFENGTRDMWNPWKASMDRVDNKKGYTITNIRVVCLAFNLAKHQFTEDTFDKLCLARMNYLTGKCEKRKVEIVNDKRELWKLQHCSKRSCSECVYFKGYKYVSDDWSGKPPHCERDKFTLSDEWYDDNEEFIGPSDLWEPNGTCLDFEQI